MPAKNKNLRKSSVTRNNKDQITSWFVLLWKSLIAISLILIVTFVSFLAYNKITQQAFLPLKRVLLERPLVYANYDGIEKVIYQQDKHDFINLDINKVARDLNALSWVEKASVSREWPDAIKITILERIPYLRWNSEQFLDREGNVFKVPMTENLATLFSLYGPEGTEKNIIKMYEIIQPWMKDRGIKMTGFGLDTNFVWSLKLDNIDIILGENFLEARLKKLVIVDQRIVKRYKKYIKSIDLRYKDGFSVQWIDDISPDLNKGS